MAAGSPSRGPAAALLSGGDVAEIRVGDGDSIERVLKQFRRKLQREGLFKELRRRRHYLKPSAARLVKSALARRRKNKKRDQDWD
jgi:small subunit ribosomal protein S21